VIAAQQTGTAGADRNAAGDSVNCRLPQFLGFGEAEIVVRGEIHAGTRAQASQPVLVFELTKLGFNLFVNHRFARGEWALSEGNALGLADGTGAIGAGTVRIWRRF